MALPARHLPRTSPAAARFAKKCRRSRPKRSLSDSPENWDWDSLAADSDNSPEPPDLLHKNWDPADKRIASRDFQQAPHAKPAHESDLRRSALRVFRARAKR